MRANKKQILFFALYSPWNCLPGFEKVLNVQVYGLAHIRERLLIRVAPGVTTLERWTRGVPGVSAVLEFIGLDGHFENVGFHRLYTSCGLAGNKTWSIRLSHGCATFSCRARLPRRAALLADISSTNICKTLAPISAPASPPPHISSAADTLDTSGRRVLPGARA